MRLRVCIVHILFLLTSLAAVARPAPEGNPPEARARYPYAVPEQAVFDLGQVVQGPVATGTIVIANEGAADLRIARVRSSCGLMIPAWPDGPVAPGDKARVGFRYDTGRLGPFERIVIIHTNAWQRDLRITVRGEVVPSGE
jgi:hypothetical protein